MRVTFLHSVQAGHDESSGYDLLTALQEAGYEAVYQALDETELDEALQDPGAFVVVAGGDGTVGAIAKRLVQRGIPIGIIPSGTANNISKTLGLAAPPEQLITSWELAQCKSFDVGVARGPWGEMHFLEAVGVGLFAQLLPLLEAAKERLHPRFEQPEDELAHDLRFIKAALASQQAREWQLILDGKDLSGRYLLVEAMNIGALGPNLHLAPDADPGDGLLDVVLLREDEREELLAYLKACLDGQPVPADLTVRQGRHLQMQWGGPEVHVDSTVWVSEASPFPKMQTPNQAPPVTIDVQLEQHALKFLVVSSDEASNYRTS